MYATTQSVPRPSLSPPGVPQQHLPHIPAPFRQLHPPKSPLYRPAVLRATEGLAVRPPSASPSTSPKSSIAGGDYGSETKSEDGSERGDIFDESAILEFGEDDAEERGRVTGPPRRTHWKADSEAPVCDSPSCIRAFTFYIRRHHCRRCGYVFCHQHALNFLPLNQNGRVHPQGHSSRVCDECFKDYKRTRSLARRSGSVSSSISTDSSGSVTPVKPIMNGRQQSESALAKLGSYVGSVPRDWSWSTF